jgi:2-polyprenyl-6-hydroxyphenyl methylase/3-demethylubiquinone-9 3-methyltransferase
MSQTTQNIDPREVAKFEELASRWWDPHSEFKPLHDINPLRLHYIDSRASLAGKRVVDVGCGGGILAESMALHGAAVIGIDAGAAPLAVARLHLLESGAEVDYRQITAEQLADQHPGTFDIVTCMEMLEHVPDPASVVAACARLVKPGGQVFFSTLNRTPKAYLLAIVGAEYLLNMLPKGTHDYSNFIRPSELAHWVRPAGLTLHDLTGMTYNPLTRTYSLGNDIDVNYLAHCSLERADA